MGKRKIPIEVTPLGEINKKDFGALLKRSVETKYPDLSFAAVAEGCDLTAQQLYEYMAGHAMMPGSVLISALDYFGVPLADFAALPSKPKVRKKKD